MPHHRQAWTKALARQKSAPFEPAEKMLSEVEKDWGIIQEQDFSEVAPKMYFCLQEVEFDVNGTKGKLCPGDVVELEDDIANVLMEGRHITRAVWRLGPQHAR